MKKACVKRKGLRRATNGSPLEMKDTRKISAIRRTVVWNIGRRELFLRAGVILLMVTSVCAAGFAPWPGRRGGVAPQIAMPNLGPSRDVPGVLLALRIHPQLLMQGVLDALGLGPTRYVPNILPVSLEKGWVSSEFGSRIHPITGRRHNHSGIDLAVDEGVPIRAAADGTVIFAGDDNGYGRLVKINHGNGIETRYAHNSVLKAKGGQRVRRGQVIALAGHSGRATGDHLHYEVRVSGTPVNPRNCLPEKFVEGGRKTSRE